MPDNNQQPTGFDSGIPGLSSDQPKTQESTPAPQPDTAAKPDPKQTPDTGDSVATMPDIHARIYEYTKRAAEDHEFGRRLNLELMQKLDNLSKAEGAASAQYESQLQNSLQDYPQPPSTNQGDQKKNIGGFLAYTALAIALGYASGSKGSYGIWKGYGEGLRNMQEGNQSQAKEAWAIFKDQVSAIHTQNEEKINVFKDIMSDRRATIKEKIDVLKMVSEAHKDATAQGHLEAEDWIGFSKYVAGLQKMNADTELKLGKYEEDFNKWIGTHPEHSAWIEEGLTKHPELQKDYYSGDYRRRGKAITALRKLLPWGEWAKKHQKEWHSTETAQEKKDDETTPEGTAPDEDSKSLDSLYDKYFGGSAKGGENGENGE
jgi:hypothetical protein